MHLRDAQPIARRGFLLETTGAVAGLGAGLCLPARLLGRDGQPGANEEIIVGVIGTGNRARQLMDQLPSPARIVAIADCYEHRMAETLTQKQAKWNTYQDYRRMLDQENLDAVIVGTPDHARTLPCIHAVLAGLDVYAEKPLTAYVREGRVLVDAVRKHNRIFQVGTQQRTMEINKFCCELVHNGGIGKVERVSAVNYPGPALIPDLGEEPVPEGDDWDMWCGPTQLRPFNQLLQFQWMRWRDYSGGQMTNWGAHGVDQIQWALGMSHSGPTELWPEQPRTSGKVSMRYADGTLVNFEREAAPLGGAVFIGSECKMEINRNRFATNPADFVQDAPEAAVQEKWEGPGWIARPHLQNWLDCIRSREMPNADVEIGHRSITVCHLLNITRELGRRLKWDPSTERFVDDDQANRLLDRPRRRGYELPIG
jgi:predicted dehydrogenase